MRVGRLFKLVIAISVCEAAGVVGAFFTTPSIAGWYATLARPALNPPAWVFGPVWTTLFALMGIAAFLVWRKGLDRRDVKITLGIFIGQLVLNTLWSIIFFGLHNPGAAFVEIIFLWLAILATIVAFAKISKPAALLLLPYILWVSFAGYLNFSIWKLNSLTNLGQMACTEEAKQCPDGSYVGRTGPKCEFAACPSPISNNSGVSGIVLLGPTCPVERIPPDPTCADKPYSTKLVVTTSDQSRVITEFTSDANGKFSVVLAPGEYAIRNAVTANILPYCGHDKFKVEANTFTNITVSCDTGIR